MPPFHTRRCCVYKCSSNNTMDEMKFYMFPKDPSQREVWKNVVNRPDYAIKNNSFMCMLHFAKSQFTRGLRLVHGAVPSCNPELENFMNCSMLGNKSNFQWIRIMNVLLKIKNFTTGWPLNISIERLQFKGRL